MPNSTPKPPRDSSQLVFGIFLLVLGALLLASNLGFYIPFRLWQLWPVPLMVFGGIGLILPSRHLSRIGGLWLFTVGLYGAIGTFDWLDLGWNAWPLFLIAAGLNVIWNRKRHDEEQSRVTHEA